MRHVRDVDRSRGEVGFVLSIRYCLCVFVSVVRRLNPRSATFCCTRRVDQGSNHPTTTITALELSVGDTTTGSIPGRSSSGSGCPPKTSVSLTEWSITQDVYPMST